MLFAMTCSQVRCWSHTTTILVQYWSHEEQQQQEKTLKQLLPVRPDLLQRERKIETTVIAKPFALHANAIRKEFSSISKNLLIVNVLRNNFSNPYFDSYEGDYLKRIKSLQVYKNYQNYPYVYGYLLTRRIGYENKKFKNQFKNTLKVLHQ